VEEGAAGTSYVVAGKESACSWSVGKGKVEEGVDRWLELGHGPFSHWSGLKHLYTSISLKFFDKGGVWFL